MHDVWEVPEHVWPDGRQCFLTLQERPGLLTEPVRIIDLHVSDLSDAHSHLDVRRHGTPVVLHDPDGRIVLEEEDVGGRRWRPRSTRRGSVARPTSGWSTGRWRAGHPAEAVDFYLRFALATLVRLVRVEHCPWRHDFGLRYLRDDLPADVADRLEALVPGHSPRSLRDLSGECFAWIDELLG